MTKENLVFKSLRDLGLPRAKMYGDIYSKATSSSFGLDCFCTPKELQDITDIINFSPELFRKNLFIAMKPQYKLDTLKTKPGHYSCQFVRVFKTFEHVEVEIFDGATDQKFPPKTVFIFKTSKDITLVS
ncbi:MAG: hypothetical protein V4439_03730 [Patescibacteria group bacterium]